MADKIIEINNLGDLETSRLEDKINKISMDDMTLDINKSELVQVDQPSNSLEMTSDQKAQALKDLIGPVLDNYNKRYSTKVKYEDLKDTIEDVLNSSVTDLEIKRIVNSDLVYNATNYVSFKAILALTKTLNEMIDDFVTSSSNRQFTGDNIVIIDQIFNWLTKIEEIKSKYKITNIDKILSESKRGSVTKVRSERENALITALKESLK